MKLAIKDLCTFPLRDLHTLCVYLQLPLESTIKDIAESIHNRHALQPGQQTLTFATVKKRSDEKEDAYVGMVAPIESPFHLFLRMADLQKSNKYIYFFGYSIGSKSIILWGIYDKDNRQFLIDDYCKWKLIGRSEDGEAYNIGAYMSTWKNLGKYQYIANTVSNRPKKLISKYTRNKQSTDYITDYNHYRTLSKFIYNLDLTNDENMTVYADIARLYNVCNPMIDECITPTDTKNLHGAMLKYIDLIEEDMIVYRKKYKQAIIVDQNDYTEATKILEIVKTVDLEDLQQELPELFLIRDNKITAKWLEQLRTELNTYEAELNLVDINHQLKMSLSTSDMQQVALIISKFNKLFETSKYNQEYLYKNMKQCPPPWSCSCALPSTSDPIKRPYQSQCLAKKVLKQCHAYFHGLTPYYISIHDDSIN